jgi:serine/threonine-protein kinase
LKSVFVAGDKIGAYTILRRIGAGGMGEVYLAEHVHIGRKAAIKMLLPELSSRADVVARFFKEARATGQLKHPGIIEILDCDVHPSGSAYIVMEYLAGENLGQYLARAGSFAAHPRTAAAIAGQIASALAAAHGKGIIHRDLKPDNVFLAPTPEAGTPVDVKILDFGIAKLVGEDTAPARQTRTGTLLGTPIYMSPEQCRGTGRIDHRTDIYSLGCVIFEMIGGRPPFVRAGLGELIAAHLGEEPPELSSIVPSTPAVLGALVGRMLAKDPDRRPVSMGDIVREIEDLLAVPSPSFLALIALPEPVRIPPVDGQDDGQHRQDGHQAADPSEGDPLNLGTMPTHARASGTQLMPPAPAATGGLATRTQPPSGPPVRPRVTASGTQVAAAPAATPGQKGTAGRAVALVAVAVVGLVGAAAFLALRRGGDPSLPARPLALDGGAGARRTPTHPDPTALASLAPLLQVGAEPPFPDRCRTTDADAVNGLAGAARDLIPGATDDQRARGVAALRSLPESLPERWLMEARSTLAADPRGAEQAAARAVSLCATSAVAANLHGNALQMLQQIAPAEAAYREAVRLAPAYLAPEFNLGLLRLRSDDAPPALAIFNEIARVKADYPNIHLVRAEAHRRLGDRAAATADLEEQVRRQPDSADGWLQLGRALSARDRRRANAAFCRAKSLGHADAAALCRP